jgi:hypothetical protein
VTGELDFGNIDTFKMVDPDDGPMWKLTGEWGSALVGRPTAALTLDN